MRLIGKNLKINNLRLRQSSKDPPSRRNSPRSSLSDHSNHTPSSNTSGTHIKLPTIALPTFEADTYSWLQFRDTFEALIVNNTTLSNVQKLHCLIASLKNEVKDLINNLQITNENFLVSWQLVTQRYCNKRLIVMMQSKYLCQRQQIRKRDASSLRQLINHVSSHMNALKNFIIDSACTRFNFKSFDASHTRPWNSTRMGAYHRFTRRCTKNSRVSYIPWIKVQSPWDTSDNSITKTFPNIWRSSQLTENKVSKSYYNVATQLLCSLCNGSRRLFKCDKFLKMQAK